MNNKEAEELKTFLTLKHGSLDMLYSRWLLDEIKLTSAEMDIIIAHSNEKYEDMLATRLKCRRAVRGVF